MIANVVYDLISGAARDAIDSGSDDDQTLLLQLAFDLNNANATGLLVRLNSLEPEARKLALELAGKDMGMRITFLGRNDVSALEAEALVRMLDQDGLKLVSELASAETVLVELAKNDTLWPIIVSHSQLPGRCAVEILNQNENLVDVWANASRKNTATCYVLSHVTGLERVLDALDKSSGQWCTPESVWALHERLDLTDVNDLNDPNTTLRLRALESVTQKTAFKPDGVNNGRENLHKTIYETLRAHPDPNVQKLADNTTEVFLLSMTHTTQMKDEVGANLLDATADPQVIASIVANLLVDLHNQTDCRKTLVAAWRKREQISLGLQTQLTDSLNRLNYAHQKALIECETDSDDAAGLCRFLSRNLATNQITAIPFKSFNLPISDLLRATVSFGDVMSINITDAFLASGLVDDKAFDEIPAQGVSSVGVSGVKRLNERLGGNLEGWKLFSSMAQSFEGNIGELVETTKFVLAGKP